jgi:hypothetical protein
VARKIGAGQLVIERFLTDVASYPDVPEIRRRGRSAALRPARRPGEFPAGRARTPGGPVPVMAMGPLVIMWAWEESVRRRENSRCAIHSGGR